MYLTKTFKKRSDIHLVRKLWHLFGVLFIVYSFNKLQRMEAIKYTSIIAFSFIFIDLARLQFPPINNIIALLLRPIMRESEKYTIAGTSYLIFGTFINILLFPKKIVLLSLLFLAVADPLASYVGIKYGKDKIVGNKSLQGSFAAFISCTIIAALFYYFNNLMTERIIIVSLLSGLSGAVSELLPLGRLDDNFSFPIFSSIFLFVLFYLFGGF